MQKDLYSHLSTGCYELKKQHIQDVKKLMVEAFVTNNKIWSSANLDHQQLAQFFQNAINQHLKSQENVRKQILPNAIFNFIYVLNGKLISCLLHYEIDEYRRSQKNYKESEVPLFRELQRQGRQLIKCVDVDSLERGKYIYCTWTAHINDRSINRMKKIAQVADVYDQIRLQGLHGMICRSSNLNVVEILKHLGGQLLKESNFVRNQKEFKLYFAMLHLQNQNLLGFIQNTKKQVLQQMSAKL